MPIASSKSSKPGSLMDGNDISKSGLLLVEKKVRNLEKRKIKLDGYKKQMDDGEILNEDQKRAIANLTAVEMNLEMAKDLLKQFQQMHNEYLKALKKQARREQVASQAAKYNADVSKVGEVLELQSLMDDLSEDVRTDFLNGTNGAVSVKEEEFGQIDNFYKLITPDSESDVEMLQQISEASKHIVNLFNANSGEVAGTTYKALHEVIDRIKKCGYFQPKSNPQPAKEEEEELSSGLSTPNGELSGSGEDVHEEATQPQETVTEPNTVAAPTVDTEEHTTEQPSTQQKDSTDNTKDVTSFTNEHGLNFLGDSEVEKVSEPVLPPIQPVSDWGEEVENGQHGGELDAGPDNPHSNTNGYGQRGRGGGRGGSGGFRGNYNRRGDFGGDRGQRRGSRGGFGPPRGGGRGGYQDDGFRRGGRGGRGGFSRGGGGPRGARRGGPSPQ